MFGLQVSPGTIAPQGGKCLPVFLIIRRNTEGEGVSTRRRYLRHPDAASEPAPGKLLGEFAIKGGN
jgi:hypothetical protein